MLPLIFVLSFGFAQEADSNLKKGNKVIEGDSLYTLGEFSKAILVFQELSEGDERELRIARTYDAMGNTSKALESYERAISLNPEHILAQYLYGKLLNRSGRLQKADSLFTVLATAAPENPNVHYYLGLVREKRKDTSYIASYSRAYEIDSNHINSVYKLARHFFDKRKFGKARIYTEAGLSKDPNSVRFLTLKAFRHYLSKDYHKAIGAYEKLIDLGQSTAQLHEKLGISFTKTNQFEKAMEQFKILINTYDDQNPKWHFLAGQTFFKLKDFENSVKHIELSIAFQEIPLENEYFELATAFRAQKQYSKEFKALQQAVKENPKSQKALYFLATSAERNFEDKKKALSYYEAYLDKFPEDGIFTEHARTRIKDLKTKLHFSDD